MGHCRRACSRHSCQCSRCNFSLPQSSCPQSQTGACAESAQCSSALPRCPQQASPRGMPGFHSAAFCGNETAQEDKRPCKRRAAPRGSSSGCPAQPQRCSRDGEHSSSCVPPGARHCIVKRSGCCRQLPQASTVGLHPSLSEQQTCLLPRESAHDFSCLAWLHSAIDHHHKAVLPLTVVGCPTHWLWVILKLASVMSCSQSSLCMQMV